MTIHGKGPVKSSRSNIRTMPMRTQLPKDLKKAWPDPAVKSSVSIFSTFGLKADITPVLRRLNIRKTDRILDIGAFKNEVVESLQEAGYVNSVGIDINPEILASRFGRHINIRDLPLSERFHLIYFGNLLNHFPGGMFCRSDRPSLGLFARKLNLHLEPGGSLVFYENASNAPDLAQALLKNGFRRLEPLSGDTYYFQRV